MISSLSSLKLSDLFWVKIINKDVFLINLFDYSNCRCLLFHWCWLVPKIFGFYWWRFMEDSMWFLLFWLEFRSLFSSEFCELILAGTAGWSIPSDENFTLLLNFEFILFKYNDPDEYSDAFGKIIKSKIYRS